MNVEAQKDDDEARGALLAVGQSNVAADNLAWRCINKKLRVTRFGDAKIMSQDLLDISTQKQSADEWNKSLDDLYKESRNARKQRQKYEMGLMENRTLLAELSWALAAGKQKL